MAVSALPLARRPHDRRQRQRKPDVTALNSRISKLERVAPPVLASGTCRGCGFPHQAALSDPDELAMAVATGQVCKGHSCPTCRVCQGMWTLLRDRPFRDRIRAILRDAGYPERES
jgi:hypothetical protein